MNVLLRRRMWRSPKHPLCGLLLTYLEPDPILVVTPLDAPVVGQGVNEMQPEPLAFRLRLGREGLARIQKRPRNPLWRGPKGELEKALAIQPGMHDGVRHEFGNNQMHVIGLLAKIAVEGRQSSTDCRRGAIAAFGCEGERFVHFRHPKKSYDFLGTHPLSRQTRRDQPGGFAA
jgi:hypothetical protein